jgi:PPM family protein phosphatase
MSMSRKGRAMSFLRITAFGDTNQGLVRKNNEDYVTYFEPGRADVVEQFGRLYIVADGVGGAATGEVASKFSALKVLHMFFSQPALKPWQRIKVGMKRANEELVAYIRQNAQARMATTLTVAAINGEEMTVVNVGDSRAYLIRNNGIKQITQDHSLVNEMIRNGILTEEEAKTAKVKNQLTSSLGGHETFKADVFVETIEPGDRVLLCSDGFCRYAEDPEVVKKFALSGTPEEVVRNCIQYALKSGGQDNVTVLVFQVEERQESTPDSYDHGGKPYPVDLREVVNNPLTFDARSPFQELSKLKQEQASDSTMITENFVPDLSAPKIPVREAYAIPGINMAATDEELDAFDETMTPQSEEGTMVLSVVDEDNGNRRGITPDEMRAVTGQNADSEPAKHQPEASQPLSQKISMKAYVVLLILSAMVVIILGVMAVLFGMRYLNRTEEMVAPTTTPNSLVIHQPMGEWQGLVGYDLLSFENSPELSDITAI